MCCSAQVWNAFSHVTLLQNTNHILNTNLIWAQDTNTADDFDRLSGKSLIDENKKSCSSFKLMTKNEEYFVKNNYFRSHMNCKNH